MKKILFAFITFFIVFLIYYFNIDKGIYYVSIGDQLSYGINNFKKVENTYSDNIKKYYQDKLKKYVNFSSINDYRVMDLINDINYNKTVNYENNEYKIQNLLIKSNMLTISIGMNDLIYANDLNILDYNYIDELLIDIEKLLKIIRKYNKEKIYFLSFYNIINNEELIKYSNNKLKKICDNLYIYFIDISNLDKYIMRGIYPTNDGYTYIKEKILNFTK